MSRAPRPARPGRRPLRLALLALLVPALAWLGLALWSARAARTAESEHPPVGRFVEVDGARVHYLRRGPAQASDEPTLVFLHGAGTSLLDAVPALLPRLAERFDVVAVDRPGHGYSERGDAPDGSAWVDPLAQARRVAGALEAIGVGRALWIGHSWAGSVVLAALLELPERSAAAGVVVAGAIYPWPDGPAPHVAIGATPVLGSLFARALVEPFGRVAIDRAVRGVFAPEPVPPGYARATGLALSLRPDAFRHDAIDRARLSGWLEGIAPRWAEIDRPLLSIAGGADRVVPPARHAHRLREARPVTRTVTLEGAGHGLVQTRAPRLAALIGELAASLPAASRAAPR